MMTAEVELTDVVLYEMGRERENEAIPTMSRTIRRTHLIRFGLAWIKHFNAGQHGIDDCDRGGRGEIARSWHLRQG